MRIKTIVPILQGKVGKEMAGVYGEKAGADLGEQLLAFASGTNSQSMLVGVPSAARDKACLVIACWYGTVGPSLSTTISVDQVTHRNPRGQFWTLQRS